MFNPPVNPEMWRARAVFSVVLFFLVLQTQPSVAAESGASTLPTLVAEKDHPAPAHELAEDGRDEPVDHDGHAVATEAPEADPGPARQEPEHANEGHAGQDAGHMEHDPDAGQDSHDHGHEDVFAVELSLDQRRVLDLEISTLEPRVLGETLRAPGEVRLNAYATAQVTPRIAAQVVARHARLGEQVEAGQSLVTLSSVDMAEAQGDCVVAEREWQRLTKLKGEFVSESDYLEASVARQKALSRVLAYGMTQSQADALVTGASEKADGTFELLAPRGGTIVRDAFVLGELVEPGRVLFEITDEAVRWVEARMPPEEAARVAVGDQARVAYLDAWLDGNVTQIHHLLDETTRTQAVRIEVPDLEHRLHPGVFVDVVILAGDGAPALAVPEAAVLRSPDGDWQVFVADAGDSLRPVEVELVRTVGGMAVIEGLSSGTRVVTRGAFFLQSELAKAGFDPHNH